MFIVETDHFKQRAEERGIGLQEIFYDLEDRIRDLRTYKYLNSDIAYKSGRFTLLFRVKNKTIILKTVIDKEAVIKNAVIM